MLAFSVINNLKHLPYCRFVCTSACVHIIRTVRVYSNSDHILSSINSMAFVMETCCVFCEVGVEPFFMHFGFRHVNFGSRFANYLTWYILKVAVEKCA